jgi:hypothetical protein
MISNIMRARTDIVDSLSHFLMIGAQLWVHIDHCLHYALDAII